MNPFDDQRERLNFNIMKSFLESHKFSQFQKELTEKLAYEIEQKIHENLKTCTPELLVNFTQVYRDLSLNFKEINKMMKDIEKKSKKIFQSSSLTEEVFKIRDDVKEITKKLDRLTNGIKKIFVTEQISE